MGVSVEPAIEMALAVCVISLGYAAAAACWYPKPPSRCGRDEMRADGVGTLSSGIPEIFARKCLMSSSVLSVVGLFHSVLLGLVLGWAKVISEGRRWSSDATMENLNKAFRVCKLSSWCSLLRLFSNL